MGVAFPSIQCSHFEDEVARERFVGHFWRENRFDHRNRFLHGEGGGAHTVARIHVVADALPGITGGEMGPAAFCDEEFDFPPYIYLENDRGEVFGWRECQAEIAPEHVAGLIFHDRDGDFWFWGRSFDEGGDLPRSCRTQGWNRLVRIDPTVAPAIAGDVGALAEIAPFEGDFALTREARPVLTVIDGCYGTTDTVLAAAQARVDEYLAASAPDAPSDAPEI